MVNLLDIHVEPITPPMLKEFDRIAMVDVQPHYFGGLIDRVDLVIDHHPEQPGYTADLQGHPRRLRIDVDDSDRAPARRRREHLGADGHGDALRDQVRHAVLQPADQPRRPRGVLLSLPARRRRADPQDGGRGNHARAARLRDEGASDRHARRPGVLRVPRAVAARRLHPVRRRLLPAARRRQVDGHRRHRRRRRWWCRFGIWATRRTRASSPAATLPTSAAPAVTAPWPRRSCRCARSARSSAIRETDQIGARLQELVAQFLHDAPKAKDEKEEVRSSAEVRLGQQDSGVRSPSLRSHAHPSA